jgi:hypothetical protein
MQSFKEIWTKRSIIVFHQLTFEAECDSVFHGQWNGILSDDYA